MAGGRGSRLAEETEVEIQGHGADRPTRRFFGISWATTHITAFATSWSRSATKLAPIQHYFEDTGETRPELSSAEEHRCYRKNGLGVELIDTGPDTQNGGRIKRLAPYLDDSTFMLTWCDGLADIDIEKLLAFHRAHGKLATLTAVHPPARFGRLMMTGDAVDEFQEKTIDPNEWINGAYFVLEPAVLDLIDGDDTHFESETLARLARDGELMAYRHESFWQCMDTLKEAKTLNAIWREGRAPWKKI